MPALTVKLAPLPSEPVLRRLAEALTAVTADTLDKCREVTAVVFEPVPVASWWIGGEPVRRATAMLEIRVTAGTNTADQKARFIEAADAVLQRHLAPHAALEEASYIVVNEVPGTDWGYDGLTQRERQLARVPNL